MSQVQAILGDSIPWAMTSRDVDLPELQGEPEDIAREKCQLAVEKVSDQLIPPSLHHSKQEWCYCLY